MRLLARITDRLFGKRRRERERIERLKRREEYLVNAIDAICLLFDNVAYAPYLPPDAEIRIGHFKPTEAVRAVKAVLDELAVSRIALRTAGGQQDNAQAELKELQEKYDTLYFRWKILRDTTLSAEREVIMKALDPEGEK